MFRSRIVVTQTRRRILRWPARPGKAETGPVLDIKPETRRPSVWTRTGAIRKKLLRLLHVKLFSGDVSQALMPRRQVLLGGTLVLAGAALVSSCAPSLTYTIKSKDPKGQDTTETCQGYGDYIVSGCSSYEHYAAATADFKNWKKTNPGAYAFWYLDEGYQYLGTVPNPHAIPGFPCPAISFAQSLSTQALGFEAAVPNVDLVVYYRQTDGNFTAKGFSVPPPMLSNVGTKLNDQTQAQNVFTSCYDAPPWTPAAHSTLLGDLPGAMAQAIAVSNLGGTTHATLVPHGHDPVSSTDPGTLSVWLDTQDTLFQSKTDYPLGYDYPAVVLAADFNGDGKRDVAVLNSAGPTANKGSVQVLLGNGNGTLRPAVSYVVGGGASSMTWADFNLDGRADLAVFNHNDQSVSILMGKADGTLSTSTVSLPSSLAFSDNGVMVAADFDGDGKVDLLVLGNNTPSALLHGNGDGTFQVKQVTATFSNYEPVFLAAGDFNKDGMMDLAILQSDGTVSILLNGGAGNFPAESRYMIGTPKSVGSGMFAMDINDDGNLDLVLASGHPDALFPTGTNMTILFGKGDGTFRGAPLVVANGNFGKFGSTTSMTAADFNGDGLLDLVAATSIFLGKSGGGFRAAGSTNCTPAAYVTAADVNSDGRADVVTLSGRFNGNNVAVCLGNGDGTFQKPATYSAASGNAGATFVAVGDVNGDGRPDLVLSYGDGDFYPGNTDFISGYSIPSSALLMTAKAGGGFNAGVNIPTGTNTMQVALADVNGDGKLDLIAANLGIADQQGLVNGAPPPSAGNVTVSLGNGDGTFRPAVAYTVGRNPISVAVADVNGDGKPDLIVGTIAADPAAKIAVLLGSGNGTFGAPTLFATYSWPKGLALADFNGDGILDLAIMHGANDAPTTIMQGNGDGTFMAEMVLPTGDTPSAIVAADFDGDGKPDLAVMDKGDESSTSGSLVVFHNTSAGSACTYTLSANPSQFAAAGGTGSFTVTVASGCPWTAVSNNPDWITVTGTSGATVNYSVARNTGAARNGSIGAGGQQLLITQAAGSSGGSGSTPVSALPGAGSGFSSTFTFTFNDPAGWQDLDVVNILINNFLDGRNAWYLAYSRSGGVLYLVPDSGGGLLPALTLGSGASDFNGQCAVYGTGSSAVGSGNTLTLTLSMGFNSGFAGNKVIYMAARDLRGNNSGWQALGTWGVPPLPAAGPNVGGVATARTTGSGAVTYTFTFNDTNGVADLGVLNILVNDALNGNNACYLAYARAANQLYLVNDAGSGLLPAMTLNGSGTLGNSQCTVSGAGSSATPSGNTLTLVLNMTFPSSFAGNRVIYMAARSNGDVLNSGWQAVGSRTIQ
jgi:hypothetical protein